MARYKLLTPIREQSTYHSYAGSRRRSKSYSEINDTSYAHNEVTPLLLAARLNSLLRAPLDKGKRVCLVFLYLGMCTMLPWNFLISITAFWNYKFRDVGPMANLTNASVYPAVNATTTEITPSDIIPSDRPTEMQLSFPSYMAIASNIPGAITTILHSGFGQRVSVGTRMAWSLTVLFLSFTSLMVLSIPDSDQWQARFLHIVIMVIVLSNVGVNVLQGSMFGISGRFPPLYAGAVMMGQAMGGVVPALAAVALTAFEVEPRLLGPACFAAVLLLLLAAMVLFHWLKTSKFFLYYAEGKDNHGVITDHDEQVDKLCYKEIVKKSWPYLVAGYLTYATTLSIFPAITSLVQSQTKSKWTDKYFTPVASVLLFNCGDLLGRTLGTFVQWPKRSNFGKLAVLVVSLIRVGLVPLFMYCNVAPENRALPVIFRSDAWFCTFIVVMAMSVGYLGNICLTQAPKTSEDADSQEATSLILTATFVLGQATGSFGSYFVLKAI